ncbi:unnamed protein product [Camellia sinensis]
MKESPIPLTSVLIFRSTEYTTAIDVWFAGCVVAELLLGQFDYLHRARLLLDLVIYKHNSADIVADIAQYKAELKARDELKRK